MREEQFQRIAVLLTCHNRRDKTLACLNSLFAAILPIGFKLSVFLVDDGSTDGTGVSISDQFPEIFLIQGDGSLFWNHGMRLAWSVAASQCGFDFFLWLNDDTFLDRNALSVLLNCAEEALGRESVSAIITGACRDSGDKHEFSYGGRIDRRDVVPNGQLQVCTYINGNVVLIPKEVYEKLGNLSPDFTHSMGDYDYGLRAIKAGFKCYTTKTYIATCPPNEGISAWCNPGVPLLTRLQYMRSPKGLNIKEYCQFVYRHHGVIQTVIAGIKAYLKVTFPNTYEKIKGYLN